MRTPVALVVASLLLGAPAAAHAQVPPLVQAGPAKVQPASHHGGGAFEGKLGVRPFIGVFGDMGLSPRMLGWALSGSKFLLGADVLLGGRTGVVWVGGLHLGFGSGTVLFEPVLGVHYRFHLSLPLVPWIGAGVALKFGFGQYLATNVALTFRFVAGLEYVVSRRVAVGMELVLPDLGPVFVHGDVFGDVEWLVGPHIRF